MICNNLLNQLLPSYNAKLLSVITFGTIPRIGKCGCIGPSNTSACLSALVLPLSISDLELGAGDDFPSSSECVCVCV